MKINKEQIIEQKENEATIPQKFSFNFFMKNIIKQKPNPHIDEENIFSSLNEQSGSCGMEQNSKSIKEEKFSSPLSIEKLMEQDKEESGQKKQNFEVKNQDNGKTVQKNPVYSFDSSFEELDNESLINIKSKIQIKFKFSQNKTIASKKLQSQNLKEYFVEKFNLDQEKQHKCQICNKSFRNPTALGGHMSRSHPNMSISYKIRCSRMLLYKGEKDRKKFIQKSQQNIYQIQLKMFSDRNIRKMDTIQNQIEMTYTDEIPMNFQDKFKNDLALFALHLDLMDEQNDKEMKEKTLMNALSHFFQAVLVAKEDYQETNLDLILDQGVALQNKIKSVQGYWEEMLIKLKKGEDFEKTMLSFYMPPLTSVFTPEKTQEDIFVDFKLKLLDFWENLSNQDKRIEFLSKIPEIYKLNKLDQLIC